MSLNCLIDLNSLPSLSIFRKCRLPEISAVYVCISGTGDILYVGKAAKLFSRWRGHHRLRQLEKVEGTRIAWLACDDAQKMDEIETDFIESFKPHFNLYQTQGSAPRKLISFRLPPDLIERLAQEKNQTAAVEAALKQYFAM